MRILCFIFVSSILSAQSGEWLITRTVVGGAGPRYDRVQLTFEGNQIHGPIQGGTVDGTLRDTRVELQIKTSNGSITQALTGRLAGGDIIGDIADNAGARVIWSAKRIKDKPPAPQVLRYTPSAFQNYFSAAIPPVLSIFPGDTVESWSGEDASGNLRSSGTNPLTGPFFIEGAMPGDLLAVHFTRIRMRRADALGGQGIAPLALTPRYYAQQRPVAGFDNRWTLDAGTLLGRLTNPSEKLRNFRAPLHPMLGCVGVAPPGQLSTPTSALGFFGGNLDYNQLTEGTTVYLPVFHPGALLFIGDGHAAQGDGELNGQGLETPMEWAFRVDVIRGKSIANPRFENQDEWMASGIANSLPEALQDATTNLAMWLEEEYGLNAAEIAVVLGVGVHYDVAEVTDPQKHIVARIAKSLLTQIPKK